MFRSQKTFFSYTLLFSNVLRGSQRERSFGSFSSCMAVNNASRKGPFYRIYCAPMHLQRDASPKTLKVSKIYSSFLWGDGDPTKHSHFSPHFLTFSPSSLIPLDLFFPASSALKKIASSPPKEVGKENLLTFFPPKEPSRQRVSRLLSRDFFPPSTWMFCFNPRRDGFDIWKWKKINGISQKLKGFLRRFSLHP